MQKQVIEKIKLENKKFKKFFRAVSRLAANHHVENDKACIYASELGEQLEKIDPEWYQGIPPEKHVV